VLVWDFYNVVPAANQNVYEFLGNGDGTFQAPKLVISNTDEIEVADLNGDGRPDVIEVQSASHYYPEITGPPVVNVYLAQSDGSFVLTHTYTYPGRAVNPYFSGIHRSGWLGDFNGDGKLDVALFEDEVVNAQADLRFLAGNGDGSFTPTYLKTKLHSWNLPTTSADVDGDGKADFIETEFYTSSFYVLPGANAPTFEAETVEEPVIGSGGALRLSFGVPPSAGTTIALAASDPDISIPASVATTGTTSQDVPFTFKAGFNPFHAFSLQATMGTTVAIAYGTKALPGGGAGLQFIAYYTSEEVAAGSETTDYAPGFASVNGFSTTVDVSCSGLPAGATCDLGNAEIFVPAGGFNNTTLHVVTALTTTPGTYRFVLLAKDGSQTYKLPLQLIVDSPPTPDFALSLTSANNTVLPGTTATYSLQCYSECLLHRDHCV
jgi:hypothetical protein